MDARSCAPWNPPRSHFARCYSSRAGAFQTTLVGGWSRELLGLETARPHSDIDLLVTDPDITRLDEWLSTLEEISAKRFAHKRAFRLDGEMVELHLVQRRTE
jgi:hypothetical protein